MFITETDIQTWIQPITIKNTKAMNPNALDNAYLNAVGYLKRELQGKLYGRCPHFFLFCGYILKHQ